MKQSGYQERFYRRWSSDLRFYSQRVSVAETDVQVMTDRLVPAEFLQSRIQAFRDAIEHYIHCRDKRFLTSLKPLVVESTAPGIVVAMAREARRAGVGPMAAVAGAIAQYLGRALLRRGCRDVIVENGGDIFLQVTRPVSVGVYAGDSPLSGRVRLRIDPAHTPAGVCASSGTVGHSLSFGEADAAIVICRSAVLADAVATAVGNRVKTAADFAPAITFARNIRGVRGVLLVKNDRLAAWGDILFEECKNNYEKKRVSRREKILDKNRQYDKKYSVRRSRRT